MASPRKKPDDDHYLKLLADLMYQVSRQMAGVVKPSVPRLPSRSRDARVIYHRLMLRLIEVLCLLETNVKPEVIQYHRQLIEGDLTHRHPKNLLSQLLTEKMDKNSTEESQQVQILELTIPLDGEVPNKLVTLLSQLPETTVEFYFAFEHTYISFLNELESSNSR